MAKTRRFPRSTGDDHRRHEEIQRLARERIAYHDAKTREKDERRARERGG